MAAVYNKIRHYYWMECQVFDKYKQHFEYCHAQVKEVLPILDTEGWDGVEEFLKPWGQYHINRVHLASYDGRLEMLKRADALGVDLYVADRFGRTPLHYAAGNGHVNVVRWFTERSAARDQLQLQDNLGMTALHLAVEAKHVEIVKVLVNAGVDVNIRDRKEMTPLHLAWIDVNRNKPNDMLRYENIVNVLLGSSNFQKFVDMPILDESGQIIASRTMVLNCAVSLNSHSATKQLLENGLSTPMSKNMVQEITTSLHIAAHQGFHQTLCTLLLYRRLTFWMVNMHDESGQTPLHVAVNRGHLKCAKTLVNRIGNLASVDKNGLTVIDALFRYDERPIDFLTDILDKGVYVVDRNTNTVSLNFQVLAPPKQPQMAVVSALIRAVPSVEQMKILQHPLIEAFLSLKWTRLRCFFIILVAFQAVFVACLFAYSIVLLQGKYSSPAPRRLLFVCAGIQICHITLQLFTMPRYYTKQLESWLSMICAMICVAVAIAGEFDPNLMGAVCSQDCSLDPPSPWALQSISVAILIASIQVTLLVGRFPTWGYYALMFSTVLKNVFKVFLAIMWIVIGFALSFSVQFRGNDEFDDPWRAFVKTVVMMMGEYEYANLFPSTKENNRTANNLNSMKIQNAILPVTSRIIFLVFVMLASIVLMNLMIGLAVTDIQELMNEGLTRRLVKQAEFVCHLEQVTSHWIFRGYLMPRRLKDTLESMNKIPTQIDLRSSARYGKRPRGISRKLVEKLYDLASKNRNLRKTVQAPSFDDEDSFNELYFQEAVKKLQQERMRIQGMKSPKRKIWSRGKFSRS